MSVEEAVFHTLELHARVNEFENIEQGDEEIIQYLERKSHHQCIEFPLGADWLNVSKALTLSDDLAGYVTVLDFFTYCCVNCLHILPDLEALEKAFPPEQGLVVIGVHSAKFPAEKLQVNVTAAMERYGIEHPVISDTRAVLWSRLGVTCWPSLVVLSPSSKMVFAVAGEGHRDWMMRLCSVSLRYFRSRGEINPTPLPLAPSLNPVKASVLSFPGKVCVGPGGQLFVSDSGHHRILVFHGETHACQAVVGRGEAGFVDGDFKTARFHSPQGLAFIDGALYVADTENHAIRKVDFEQSTITTVVGTGSQGIDLEGGKSGPEQPIASPWDLVVGPCPGSLAESGGEETGDERDVLYIAMAGSHQVWGYCLHDCRFWKNTARKQGECFSVAGSGKEENRNNSYPHKAAFAQPSGITLAKTAKGTFLHVADSESSSIRSINLRDGSVKNLVGAVPDPTNLFAFGDADGKAHDVRLQHPLAVSWDAQTQRLYVADSYNHKIKSVDTSTRQCETLELGKHDDGHTDFAEPGGLCVYDNRLFVADTNNHAIKVVDLSSKELSTLKLLQPSTTEIDGSSPESPVGGDMTSIVTCEGTPGQPFIVYLTVVMQEGYSLTQEAPSEWTLSGIADENQQTRVLTPDDIASPLQLSVILPATTDSWPTIIQSRCVVYFCSSASGTCQRQVHCNTIEVKKANDFVESGAVSIAFQVPKNPMGR